MNEYVCLSGIYSVKVLKITQVYNNRRMVDYSTQVVEYYINNLLKFYNLGRCFVSGKKQNIKLYRTVPILFKTFFKGMHIYRHTVRKVKY